MQLLMQHPSIRVLRCLEMTMSGAGEYGWPSSTILPGTPQSNEEKATLIDTLQDWKTSKYQDIVCE